uniref:Uncharacterized protein n=1 Tax=Megaselia scalaris TaxID=36166 RepID=T1GGV9_MEGSC
MGDDGCDANMNPCMIHIIKESGVDIKKNVRYKSTMGDDGCDATSSDCDATQVEDLPGYSPELKKRHRLNSNSFIYLEGNEKISENSSSNSSEVSENIPVESLNINRGLKEKEFEVCFNDSFIENLAQNINKAKSIHKQTPAKPDEIPTSDAKANQESSSQTLTGNILDELIRMSWKTQTMIQLFMKSSQTPLVTTTSEHELESNSQKENSTNEKIINSQQEENLPPTENETELEPLPLIPTENPMIFLDSSGHQYILMNGNAYPVYQGPPPKDAQITNLQTKPISNNTPQTNKILNLKGRKSFSTPRKHSHVRFLDFSPRNETNSVDKQNTTAPPKIEVQRVEIMNKAVDTPKRSVKLADQVAKPAQKDPEPEQAEDKTVDESVKTVEVDKSVKQEVTTPAPKLEGAKKRKSRAKEKPIYPVPKTPEDLLPKSNEEAMEAWTRLKSVNNSNFDSVLRKTQELIAPNCKKEATNKKKKNRSINKTPLKPIPKPTIKSALKSKEAESKIAEQKSSPENDEKHVHFSEDVPLSNLVQKTPLVTNKEVEKRSANIACLLDTPFKEDDQFVIPPTPGMTVLSQTLDTPLVKVTNLLQSTEKCETHGSKPNTPFAVTPGNYHDTPQSTQVEYSSGSSYYKPDEPEDLDKQMDRQFKEELLRRKKAVAEGMTPRSIEEVVDERVLPANVAPHYVMEEPLPENVEELDKDELSDAESTSSSSSSDSSSSSSSSSSSDSMSVISSEEDKSWEVQKAETEIEKHLPEKPIISNDGEVRYPLRNWITPKKQDPEEVITSIPKSVPEKPPIDEKKLITSLNEKKNRIKEKLSKDFAGGSCQLKIPVKRIVKTKIPTGTKKPQSKIEQVKKPEPQSPEPPVKSAEFLDALRLSAKKVDSPVKEKVVEESAPSAVHDPKTPVRQTKAIDALPLSSRRTLRTRRPTLKAQSPVKIEDSPIKKAKKTVKKAPVKKVQATKKTNSVEKPVSQSKYKASSKRISSSFEIDIEIIKENKADKKGDSSDFKEKEENKSKNVKEKNNEEKEKSLVVEKVSKEKIEERTNEKVQEISKENSEKISKEKTGSTSKEKKESTSKEKIETTSKEKKESISIEKKENTSLEKKENTSKEKIKENILNTKIIEEREEGEWDDDDEEDEEDELEIRSSNEEKIFKFEYKGNSQPTFVRNPRLYASQMNINMEDQKISLTIPKMFHISEQVPLNKAKEPSKKKKVDVEKEKEKERPMECIRPISTSTPYNKPTFKILHKNRNMDESL